MGNRKIDVVASQEEVIAHGDSLDPRKQRFGPGGYFKKSEIGCATSNVDDQNVVNARRREFFRPGARSDPFFQPPIKCRLRLFQQTDTFWKTSLARCL